MDNEKRIRSRANTRNVSQQLEELEEDETDLGFNHSNNGNTNKRVRGPPRMPKVWAQNEEERISVVFNEYGQPVDEETTSQLTHFMGSLSRSGTFCPLHKPWNKVAKSKKQNLLEFLKGKFDLPPGTDDWILKSFGKKVRNYRARVKKECYDPSLPFQEQISSKPKRVHKKHWRKLVRSWNKEKSKIVSEKNKQNRAKKKMVPITGKKSYAPVREELKESAAGVEPSRMKLFSACFSKDGDTKTVEASNAIENMEELRSQLPESSVDKPGPDDVFSKVMGEDKNGSASMYGLGVRSCDVWGVIPSRSASRHENLQWKSKYEELSCVVARLNSVVMEKQGSSENALNDSSEPFTSPDRVVANSSQRLRVGAEVYLKNILNLTENLQKDGSRV